MKDKFKVFLAGLGLIVLPLNTSAASYQLEGTTKENVATYEIKYVVDVANPETSEVTFQIEKQSDNSSNLVYTIEKGSTVTGNCVNSDLSCTVSTIDSSAIAEGTVLATLTITNNLSEDMLASFKIYGLEATKTYTEIPGKKTATTKAKSNDATLSNIEVSLGTFDQEFNKDIMSYNITGIKDTINKIRVTPNCDNNCSWKLICPNGECSISDGTWVNLNQGANQVSIIVESEDTTLTKTYVLKIYRGDIQLNSPYLENIILNNATLSPTFDSKLNDYTAIVGLDVDSLDIETFLEDPSANILIKGNENFKVGENIVTITVTSTDGQNKQVYTITVTKEEIKEEEIEDEVKDEQKTTKIEKKKNNKVLIIILSIIGLGLIIAAYFIIFKIRKNKKNKKDKNNKNDKNNNTPSKKEKVKEDIVEDEVIEDEKEKTTKEKIEEITKEIVIPNIEDEPKQDVDEALDDLMKTKQLELGDLDF